MMWQLVYYGFGVGYRYTKRLVLWYTLFKDISRKTATCDPGSSPENDMNLPDVICGGVLVRTGVCRGGIGGYDSPWLPVQCRNTEQNDQCTNR